jgi:hypothetical protein
VGKRRRRLRQQATRPIRPTPAKSNPQESPCRCISAQPVTGFRGPEALGAQDGVPLTQRQERADIPRTRGLRRATKPTPRLNQGSKEFMRHQRLEKTLSGNPNMNSAQPNSPEPAREILRLPYPLSTASLVSIWISHGLARPAPLGRFIAPSITLKPHRSLLTAEGRRASDP